MGDTYVNLDRLGDITSELTSSLLKSIVLPRGLLDWLKQPLGVGDRLRRNGASDTRSEVTEPRGSVSAMGPLVLMGGKPVPDEAIVAMIHILGGRGSKIAIIPVAAEPESAAGTEALRLFARFGMRGAEVLPLTGREEADSDQWCQQLSTYDALVLCGDNLSQGVQRLLGTRAAERLKALSAAGKLIGGIDAGATLLADHVIVEDGPEVKLGPGLGLLCGTLVEAGFAQRARFPLLMKAIGLSEAGSPVGFGLDGGAVAVVLAGEVKVLGDGSATFLDGRDREPGSVSGAKVHVLTAGYGFHLKNRKPLAPVKETATAATDR